MPRPKKAAELTEYYMMLENLLQTLDAFGENTGITKVNGENVDEAENKTKEYIELGYFIAGGKLVPAGTDPSELIMHMVNTKKTGSSNYKDSVHILSKPNNTYAYFSTPDPEKALKALASNFSNFPYNYQNANVLQGLDLVRDQVNKLYKDLNSTKRPWSSDSDEFKKVDEQLAALKQRMDYLAESDSDIDIVKEVKACTYKTMADEFNEVLSAIGDYSASHAGLDSFSSRQTDRLEIMNTIQSLHENILLAGLKAEDPKRANDPPFTLTQQMLDNQRFYDKFALLKIQQSDNRLFRAALTDRNIFRRFRQIVTKNESFQRDRSFIKQRIKDKSINIDKLTSKELTNIEREKLRNSNQEDSKQGIDYGFLRGNSAKIDQIMQAKASAKRTAADTISAEDLYMSLTGHETNLLNALSREIDPDFKSIDQQYIPESMLENSKKNGTYKGQKVIEAKEYNELDHESQIKSIEDFSKELKDGQIIVFDKNGKLVSQKDALGVLANKISYPDGKPAFFRYDKERKAYVGREFEMEAHSADYKVVGFKENPDKIISRDYFLVCNQVLEDVAELWTDLDKAKSFHHSTEHTKMKEALEDIYKEFGELDFSECKNLQLKDAFSKLAETANKYIDLHRYGDINDNQITRLSVAQKITAIGEALNDRNISYEQYLKNMYAKKVMLDEISATSYITKAKEEDPDQLDDDETLSDVRRHNKQTLKELRFTKNHAEKFDVKNIMKSDAFKKQTNGKSIEKLKDLLKNPSRLDTHEAFKDFFEPKKEVEAPEL